MSTPPNLPSPVAPPPPPPSPSFAGAVAVPVDPRPQAVRALCIVGFVLAGFALISPVSAVATAITPQPSYGPTTGPAVNVQQVIFKGRLLWWTIGGNVVSVAMGAWLLWASLAAWRLREAGRRGLLAYAVVAIVTAIAGGAVSALVVMPATFEAIFAAQPGGGPPAGVVTALAVVFGVVTGIVGTIYPICLLVFLRRPHVVAAFAEAADRPVSTASARL